MVNIIISDLLFLLKEGLQLTDGCMYKNDLLYHSIEGLMRRLRIGESEQESISSPCF